MENDSSTRIQAFYDYTYILSFPLQQCIILIAKHNFEHKNLKFLSSAQKHNRQF